MKARRVCAQHKDRPGFTESDQSNSWPDVDRLTEAIAAGRNKKNALVRGFLNLVDCLLQRVGIVGNSVSANCKVRRCQVNRIGGVETVCVVSGGGKRNSRQ